MYTGFITFMLGWGLGVVFLTILAIKDIESKDKTNHNENNLLSKVKK